MEFLFLLAGGNFILRKGPPKSSALRNSNFSGDPYSKNRKKYLPLFNIVTGRYVLEFGLGIKKQLSQEIDDKRRAENFELH